MTTYMISTPQITINSITAPIVPESFKYTEGLGEQKYNVESSGGGSVSPVLSDDVTKHFSVIQFEVYSTNINIENVKIWKANKQGLKISATDQKTGFTRSFNACLLVNNYEVPLASEGKISLEFNGQQSS